MPKLRTLWVLTSARYVTQNARLFTRETERRREKRQILTRTLIFLPSLSFFSCSSLPPCTPPFSAHFTFTSLLHSHLSSYPPQCIHPFLPFLSLLRSALSLPPSSSSQSSPLQLSALWLSPGLVVSVAASAGGVRPLHSVQLSSLAEGPQPRRATQERLRLLRYGSPVTWTTCGWWSWYLTPFSSMFFSLKATAAVPSFSRAAWRPAPVLPCVPAATISWTVGGGASLPSPPTCLRPWLRCEYHLEVFVSAQTNTVRVKNLLRVILESTMTASLSPLPLCWLCIIFDNSPEYNDSQYCNLLTLYLSEGKECFHYSKCRSDSLIWLESLVFRWGDANKDLEESGNFEVR